MTDQYRRRFELVDEPPAKMQRSRHGAPWKVREILAAAVIGAKTTDRWIKVTAMPFEQNQKGKAGRASGVLQGLKKGPCPKGEWDEWTLLTRTDPNDNKVYIFAKYHGNGAAS